MNSAIQYAKVFLLLAGLITGSRIASGQTGTVSQAHVLDAAGGAMSNAACSALSSIGQGIPAGNLSTTNQLAYSGFLNNFVFTPALDNDGDTVPDENDPDDDNDGIADLDELEGVGIPPVVTDPFLTDTDADGFSDADEIAAGTHPLDASSLLLLNLSGQDGLLHFSWDGRAGKYYRLLYGHTLDELNDAPIPVAIMTTNGGVSPWFEVPIETSLSPTTNQAFYAIEIMP